MSEATGTAALCATMLRRDRTRIAVWVLAVAGSLVAAASSVQGLYPSQADLDQAAAAAADSAVARAFKGPPVALDTAGGQVAFQIVALGAVAVALMSLLITSRLTRGEEESGRLELLRAAPIGRRAPVLAALGVAFGMDVVTGAIVAAGLVAIGLPAGGSVLIGAGFAATGALFATLTAATAQVVETARAASGIAGMVLAGSFVVRAIGDVGDGAASWASPIGWAQKTRPYAGDRWWPLLLSLGATAGLAAVALILVGRRDLGAGLLRPRPGPAAAGVRLRDTGALARRLQRSTVLWWTAGIILGGIAYGSIADSVASFVGDNAAVNDVLGRRGGSLLDSFMATALLILALAACGLAVQSTLRLRGEETAGRAEVLLASAVSRLRWVASHLTIDFGGAAVALVLGGLAQGAMAAIVTGDGALVGRVGAAALGYVPAVWVVTAIPVLLFGAAPRWVALGWTPLAISVVVGLFGTLLGLPGVVLDLSPFELLPSVPAEPWRALPIVVELLVAGVIVAAGLAGLRRRDVPA